MFKACFNPSPKSGDFSILKEIVTERLYKNVRSSKQEICCGTQMTGISQVHRNLKNLRDKHFFLNLHMMMRA